MKINEQLEEGMNDYGKTQNTGDLFFKFQEGENRVRILTAGEILGQHFFGKGVKPSACYGVSKGCPFHEENYVGKEILTDEEKKRKFPNVSVKYSVYLLDRADNTIKIGDLPYSVTKRIGELQEDQDYAFSEFPMPYDVKITYKSGESPANMYSVLASPKIEQVTPEVLAALKEQMEKFPILANNNKKKEFQLEDHKKQGIWVSPEDHKAAFDRHTAELNTGKATMPTVQLDETAESYVDKKYPERKKDPTF